MIIREKKKGGGAGYLFCLPLRGLMQARPVKNIKQHINTSRYKWYSGLELPMMLNS